MGTWTRTGLYATCGRPCRRLDAKTLLYRFTIEDPATWTSASTGEYTWPATDEKLYEYACHEANYALMNILRGARLKEANEASKRR